VVTIGRDPSCEIAFPEVPSLSRIHARVQFIDDVVVVEDLESTNGTFVNDHRVGSAIDLASGDRIQFGALHFKFYREMDVETAYHEAIHQLVMQDGLGHGVGEPADRRRRQGTVCREERWPESGGVGVEFELQGGETTGGLMRTFEIQGSFGLDNLRPVDRPDPNPGPGQIVVRMRAVSLNYRDLLMVRGHYNPRQPLPLIPCSDGVGVVTAVGEGVSRVAVGDRVASCFFQTWIGGPPTAEKLVGTLGGPLDGMLAEHVVLSQDGVVPAPEHMSDVEAAALPCAALTAWSALVEQGEVGADDTVLVQGTGGVSIFALQIAQLLGARVIVTSSSEAKLQRALDLGAWQTINYVEDAAWGKTVRRLTDGVGVDHVVEVGGAGTLGQSLKAVRVGGQVSVIGVLSGVSSEINIIPILMQNIRLQGILVGSREGFERMNQAITAHSLPPVVDRVFPFGEAPEAFKHMASGAHFGKICISINS